MRFARPHNIRLTIPRQALEVVFDECDRYDADETGGRVLGTYHERAGELRLAVSAIIEPGPSAKRSAVYFKQDGDYQEQVFREIETREPAIEHLGNWHTHHVNGLRHLSGGDIETYRRTVEHRNHNTEFFYALLVIERKPRKTGLERYIFKNYVLRRGDPEVYEIPSSDLTLSDGSLLWPAAHRAAPVARQADPDSLKQSRVYDSDFVSQFYPQIAPFQSKQLGIYWRGPVTLIDGSTLEVVIVEDGAAAAPTYTVTTRNPPESLVRTSETLSTQTFASCRAALISTERTCNAALYQASPHKKGRRRWIA